MRRGGAGHDRSLLLGRQRHEETFLSLIPRLKLTPEQIKDRIENGLTLTDLRDMANLAGYQSSMGKVQFQELAEAKVPVIVGITVRKHDHFVVFAAPTATTCTWPTRSGATSARRSTTFVEQWQKNAILVIAKPNAKVKEVNPLGIRFTEVFRGLLNDQTVTPQLDDDDGCPIRCGRSVDAAVQNPGRRPVFLWRTVLRQVPTCGSAVPRPPGGVHFRAPTSYH